MSPIASQLRDDGTAETVVTCCRSSRGDQLRSVPSITRDGDEQCSHRSDLERDADLTTAIGNE